MCFTTSNVSNEIAFWSGSHTDIEDIDLSRVLSEVEVNFLVEQGCVPPLCELLEVRDAKIVTVALEGLENILKVGDGMRDASGENPRGTPKEFSLRRGTVCFRAVESKSSPNNGFKVRGSGNRRMSKVKWPGAYGVRDPGQE